MPIYSVPLWQSEYHDFEEHKEIFLTAVKEYKEKNPTKENTRSNIAGYQSPDTLQGVEELRPLFEYICQMGFRAVADLDFIECDIALTSAWLNINDSRQWRGEGSFRQWLIQDLGCTASAPSPSA